MMPPTALDALIDDPRLGRMCLCPGCDRPIAELESSHTVDVLCARCVARFWFADASVVEVSESTAQPHINRLTIRLANGDRQTIRAEEFTGIDAPVLLQLQTGEDLRITYAVNEWGAAPTLVEVLRKSQHRRLIVTAYPPGPVGVWEPRGGRLGLVLGFLVTVWSSGMFHGQWFRIFYVLAGSGILTAGFAMCGGQIDQAIRSRGVRRWVRERSAETPPPTPPLPPGLSLEGYAAATAMQDLLTRKRDLILKQVAVRHAATLWNRARAKYTQAQSGMCGDGEEPHPLVPKPRRSDVIDERIERLGALERRAEILIAKTDADYAAVQAGALLLPASTSPDPIELAPGVAGALAALDDGIGTLENGLHEEIRQIAAATEVEDYLDRVLSRRSATLGGTADAALGRCAVGPVQVAAGASSPER